MKPMKPLYNQEDDKVRQALFNLNNWAMIVSKVFEDLPEDYTVGKLVVLNKSEIETQFQQAVTLLKDRYYNFLDTL